MLVQPFTTTKYFHFLNPKAVYNAHYFFLYIDIGDYGRDNDASIFSSTGLFHHLGNNMPDIPTMDNFYGFELPRSQLNFFTQMWLLKPYPGRSLAEQESDFNYRSSRTRRTMQKKCSWCLVMWIENLYLADHILKACVSSHNYLLLTIQQDIHHQVLSDIAAMET